MFFPKIINYVLTRPNEVHIMGNLGLSRFLGYLGLISCACFESRLIWDFFSVLFLSLYCLYYLFRFNRSNNSRFCMPLLLLFRYWLSKSSLFHILYILLVPSQFSVESSLLCGNSANCRGAK